MNKLINSPQNLGTTPPLEYIDATKKAGFEGIGIRTYRSPGRTYNYNQIVGIPALERDVKQALKDSGLEMYDVYSYYLQPEMDWDYIKKTLDYAGELGTKYVLVIGDDSEWNRMVENMGKIIDHIEPLGMKATIEAFATALTPTTTWMKFVNDCKPKYVGVVLDPRQAFRDEHSMAPLKNISHDLYPYAQLNDSAITGNAGVLPGEGDCPLYDYMDCLPHNIDISVEAQIPRDNVYTGHEWAKIQVERIRAFLTRYYASKEKK